MHRRVARRRLDAIQLRPLPPRERTCSFTRLDLTDYGQVVEALAGIDELHDGVDAVLCTPSAELMAQVFPDVEFRAEVPGTAALCSVDKAGGLLGWTPRHHWRDHVDAP